MSVLQAGLGAALSRGGSKSTASAGDTGGDEMAAPISLDSSAPKLPLPLPLPALAPPDEVPCDPGGTRLL